ncbi:S1 family peptidase [Dechloromonas denitrificans]|uniref:S1 family peptidase n=1 Tax=Dechloromonas denitrificans TaxID=281362 RepID=UPI001CF7FE04|nr:serine protease [Dechloromonas denitrificans]UCV05536.1 trypsin-like peptidase domain-containing protein [Dechloromonas denitrificans]UCV09883.1 trypsin-like peptidase domain-containing protein [Dechloromonas denitrificans]
MRTSKCFSGWLFAALGLCLATEAVAELADTIERVKPSIVVVGTYKKTNSPPFVLRGTGFVIGNGNLVATNSHVVPDTLEPDAPVLVIQTRNLSGESQVRRAYLATRDKEHDLAVLRIEGTALPALKLGNSDLVREGLSVGFTGFPIGGALGFSPVTHRGMISSITPIALPGATAQQLNEKVIRRIKGGTFNIFQLDATAYPGNSGSPVFDTESGDVIGIINMVFIKGSKETALSQPSGISYAIPANFLKSIVDIP